ncbi:hypothetical protein PV755_40680 [Streptomyces caniscabiei]|uniref:Secreted protein n=2 Tax=Streptomyces TaxID=1883 RepID=A0A927QJ30_9ACTN|nr:MULTISPECIES: hypothetical protein [Streptomyces]MBD9722489.1 hypothetical protein [Streptomyces caniscabiei]MDX3515159.1 hypothetical protein [Streptomyces caniscabiei]MDX3638212.1 hypothetical protein [Streptomyces sp. MB09-02B]MDX3716559.1 hypothetical protein [Streptomyces caniscabiei]MDX3732006.1 hypothetical protein [Streptomyces caniscabiei]
MEEPQQSSPEKVSALRRRVPQPALCGFLLLLALLFTGSYAVGAAVDPVAPDMQRSGTSGDDGGMDMDMGDMGQDGSGG